MTEVIYRGIYVHTPFCLQKCLYCDFPSYAVYDAEVREEYVQALCREIAWRGKQLVKEGNRVAPEATIFFGGGTPSVLTVSQLGRIVAALKEQLLWQEPVEATIEVNPGTVDLAKLKFLRKLGFDRLSIGVQSLNDRELQSIGRIHTSDQALQTIWSAGEAGFKRISADVMSGLPGQTERTLEQTLDTLTSAGLSHLSVYSLILEDGTPLKKLVQAGQVKLPDEDTGLAMYELTETFLVACGLERYEISNYARRGQESRHNMLYWHYLPYLGLGAAACSFNGSSRMTNTSQVELYNKVNFGHDSQASTIEKLTPALQLEEFLFMGLRTREGISLREARNRYGAEVWETYGRELEPFIKEGCLKRSSDGDRLALTSKGMRFGNLVFEVFVKV